MHKIKKGIKKKIKGKKGKHDDEIFTEEELEQYKREKAEEAKKLAEEDQFDQPLDEVVDKEAHEEFVDGHGHIVDEDTSPPPATANNSDWKNFLASTDTVLKTTSDNLEHIKESSYFQSHKVNEKEDFRTGYELVDPIAQKTSTCTSPVLQLPAKGWVNLEKGGIDDDSKEYQPVEEPIHTQPGSPPKKKFVELKPIEDLPELSAEDYADVFDTAYVDNIDSGDLKLIIPDSPIDEYSNEPDPFDTSAADRVLHIEEPEPKPEPIVQKTVSTGVKSKKLAPEKRKIQLVSLGNAVDVLTGKAPQAQVKVQEDNQINLLKDSPDENSHDKECISEGVDIIGDEIETNNIDNTSESKKHFERITEQIEESAIDNILFSVEESTENLSDIGIPVVNQTEELSQKNKVQSNLSDFDDLLNSNDENNDQVNENTFDLKDLVSEFDVITDTNDNKDVDDTLVPKLIEDPILDEFDAGFASLAHESVAKAKDKAIDEIGIDADDDPFDTSHVSGVVTNQEVSDRDPFHTELADAILNENVTSEKTSSINPVSQSVSPNQPKQSLLTDNLFDKTENDPFDTTIAEKILPVDYLENTENDADLADTLEPALTKNSLSRSESFDPFDTSAADAFGISELKVLESELLEKSSNLKQSHSDFDFNPRESEEPQPAAESKEKTCLLSSETEQISGSILPLQEIVKTEEEFDPFDTSIADKIQIESLEKELLDKQEIVTQSTEISSSHGTEEQLPPRPVSPVCLLAASPTLNDIKTTLQPITSVIKINIDDEIDPFDTSIADAYGKTELKVLESEFLNDSEGSATQLENIRIIGQNKASNSEVTDNLNLEIKPPRPPSPACLLAATPLDENPTLIPQTNLSDVNEEENFDPFDTSIAQQFGKTELQVLESELLTREPSPTLKNDEFDPRVVTPTENKQKPERPPAPQQTTCLLSGESNSTCSSEVPIVPFELESNKEEVDEVDPFDTSIADKFGTRELKHLEDVLLSNSQEQISTQLTDIQSETYVSDELVLTLKPNCLTKCLFETTPTDTNQPLQPFSEVLEPKTSAEAQEFDPFDTSIANQFGKTEIKELENTLLNSSSGPLQPKYNIPETIIAAQSIDTSVDPFDTSIVDPISSSSFKRSLSDEDFDPREEEAKRPTQQVSAIDLLYSTEGASLPDTPIVALQPQNISDLSPLEEDPFDTSIAASIVPGKTELKLLESELLKN